MVGQREGWTAISLAPLAPILAGFDSFVLSDPPHVRDLSAGD